MPTECSDLHDILAYWHQKRGHNNIVAHKNDIDLGQLGGLGDHSFILEQVRHGGARFRIVGMAICDLHAMELRGMPAHCLFADTYCAQFNDILRQITQHIQFARLILHSPLSNQGAQMILLPLQNSRGKLTQILGALTHERTKLRGAAAFEIKRFHTHALRPSETPKKMAVALHEDEQPFAHRDAMPKLRLIK